MMHRLGIVPQRLLREPLRVTVLVKQMCLLVCTNIIAAGSDGAHPRTAPMQYRGKRSADLRIGTNRRFPASVAESEFGAPGAVPGCARSEFGIEFALAIPLQEHTLAVQHQAKSHYETGVVG